LVGNITIQYFTKPYDFYDYDVSQENMHPKLPHNVVLTFYEFVFIETFLDLHCVPQLHRYKCYGEQWIWIWSAWKLSV